MRAYVYTDKGLAERFAGRFVWLSINTESDKNTDFLAKYKIPVLPTLFVIDPAREAVFLRYAGGATVGQLTRLLDQTLAKSGSGADSVLAAANKLAAAGKQEEAATLYLSALQQAPKPWRRYGPTAESYITALSLTGNSETCANEARRLYPGLARTTSGANVAANGLACAASLELTNPRRGELLVVLEKAARRELDNPKLDLSADDRSGLYIALIDARRSSKDDDAAMRLTAEWAAFLEAAAARAKTPEQRSVYDSHRISAYLDLGTPEKAIPMLEATARDFPDDYNPYARMAITYRAMKQYDKALDASDKALKLGYGPRKIGFYRTRADIYNDMGDKAGVRTTLEEAVRYAKSLPAVQRSERTIAALEKRLEALGPRP